MMARLFRLFRRDDARPESPPTSAPVGGPVEARGLVARGHSAEELGDFEGAERLYRAAVEADSFSADAHMNLGNALNARGESSAALASYERAVALDTEHPSAHFNLGLALLDKGDRERAEPHFRAALRLREAFPQAWFGLALVQEAKREPQAAMESYRQAVLLKPDYPEAHAALGVLYKSHGHPGAAIDSYRTALRFRPDFAAALGDLGNALQEQGEHDAAIDSFRKALALQPDHAGGHGNLLFTLNYHPDKAAEEIFDAYREFDERFGRPHHSAWREHPNNRDTGRRLKVGYVSPDYCRHPVQYFLEPLLAQHDKSVLEVYAYSQPTKEDEVTERYKHLVDHWVPVGQLSDEGLAERIRNDGIDILVDVAGHTAHNRLGAFARKPAPVSVSWLAGYGYTTGLSSIDYLLTDGVSAPRGSEHLFSEQIWRLASPAFAYRPAEEMGQVSELPAMRQAHVTFGTLSRSVRINHRTVRVWSEILRRVDGSKLVVDSRNFLDPGMRSALHEKFAAHGIAADRIKLGFHSPPWDVLRGIDIGLDCFPHNSGTTLFESLYMGVPFVTLAGRPSVGRLGSSILQSIEHPAWIASTDEQYIETAVELASDLERLGALRSGLRAEMQGSTLMDEPGFARRVETAYRGMFASWAQRPVN